MTTSDGHRRSGGAAAGLRLTVSELCPRWLARWDAHVTAMLATRGARACWPAFNKDGLHKPLSRYAYCSKGNGQAVKWTRAVIAAERGVCPAGKVGMHSCDHPGCCNPAHLVPDTQAANMADMARKERATGKSRAPRAVTNGERTWRTVSAAAMDEGVSHHTITWRCQRGWHGWRFAYAAANDDAPLELRMAA